ncbi:MAG: hypothetical protein HY055_04760 [Magnetospirillum sp.]|nr:hypothetical protein [Magnetospirillum sp.]
MRILGISSHYHDSAACLVVDGRIEAAAHEERFTRLKHDSRFPAHAVAWCLSRLPGGAADIDAVAYYDNWALKRRRSLENALDQGPRAAEAMAASLGNWGKEADFRQALGRALGWSDADLDRKVQCVQHHYSHAASAYFCSDFDDAAVVTVDGVGEYSTTTIGRGTGGRLVLDKSIDFPHSLGLMYSAFTKYLGFKVNSGEYKLMGLAPYGQPIFRDKMMGELISLAEDGSFALNLDYFRYHHSLDMADDAAIHRLTGVAPRSEADPMLQGHKDLGASIQAVLEEALAHLIDAAIRHTGRRDVCLAGGVALNCSALGKIRNSGAVDRLFVQPAAGDAGGAMGAALALHHSVTGGKAKAESGFSVYCGPTITADDAKAYFLKRGCPHEELSDDDLVERVASWLAEGKAIAWCRGPAEWGPRALGARSIIASPLVPGIKKTLNLQIKLRESFRPFAPFVPMERMADLFVNPGEAPHMSLVFFLREELRARESGLAIAGKTLTAEQFGHLKAAVIHEDWSARVQTVTAQQNPLFHAVAMRFFEKTGCPMLINTSYNARGEPMALDAADAFRCLMRTGLDGLVVDNYFLDRTRQPLLTEAEQETFELD